MKTGYHIPVLNQAPFVLLFFSSAAGILFYWYSGVPITAILLACIGLASLLLIAFYKQKSKTNSTLTIIIGLFFMMGALFTHVYLITNKSTSFKNQYQQIIVTITDPIQEKTKTNKAEAIFKSAIENDTLKPLDGKLILYFDKKVETDSLKPGTELLITKEINAIKNSGNPGAFDFAKYSLFKGVTHQAYLKEKEFTIIKLGEPSRASAWLQNLRESILSNLGKHITSAKEKGVAEALVIGYRDDMDKDLSQAYANTGTIHVIAISGLHLGSIYIVIAWLFDRAKRRFKKSKLIFYLKPITIILVLWLFTFLAGGAASIMRSAIMFTCISLGELLNRRSNIYNSLALSAFIIILLNPFSLWDAGFQLSYAAVLSIVLFMQPIYKLWFIENKWLASLWKLNAVTISAQILTLPIILYHFHQFPNYFLVANLLAVPLSNIILASLLLLFLFGWVPFVGEAIAWICTFLIRFLNTFIEWTNQLPYATTNNIQHHWSITLVLYLLITFIALALFQKSKRYLAAALCTSVLLAVVHNVNKWKLNNQHKMIVYNISGKQAIDFATAENYAFIGDSSLMQDGLQRNFNILPTRIHLQFNNNDSSLIGYQRPFVQHNNKTILLYDDNYIFNNSNKQKLDYIILSKNSNADLDSLVQKFDVNKVIIDASTKAWKAKKWITQCEQLKLPYHYVVESGAFVGY